MTDQQKYKDASKEEVNAALEASQRAFTEYSSYNIYKRKELLYEIAKQLGENEKELIAIAAKETNLAESRLRSELTRTRFQLTSYADAIMNGDALELIINTADGTAPDLRKMLIPPGPVVVFGASNFPFAYSTAGGDVASALAAGCTVIVKAHPAHRATSDRVASLIRTALKNRLPEDVFLHLHGGIETGEALVEHPLTKAVGFTGSFEGGKALFDVAAKRSIPIPVFAEMGSVNPVFLLPGKLGTAWQEIAEMYAKSITLSAGQFCTNPGILVGIENEALDKFKTTLSKKIAMVPPEKMLHPGIAKNFQHKRAAVLDVKGVEIAGVFSCPVGADESIPTLAEVSAQVFLTNPTLHQEVFGPFSLLVKCRDFNEMNAVAGSMDGQLTCSVIANDEEVVSNRELITSIRSICGRLILNGVPTGVQVAKAMHHGGPFPATTDSRFTAVGSDAIKRFMRPVCYQNWSNELLPDELKNENPLGLMRDVNGVYTKEKIP